MLTEALVTRCSSAFMGLFFGSLVLRGAGYAGGGGCTGGTTGFAGGSGCAGNAGCIGSTGGTGCALGRSRAGALTTIGDVETAPFKNNVRRVKDFTRFAIAFGAYGFNLFFEALSFFKTTLADSALVFVDGHRNITSKIIFRVNFNLF